MPSNAKGPSSNPDNRDNNTSLPPSQVPERDRKLQQNLRALKEDLESKATEIESQVAEIRSKLKNDPFETVKRHIRLLHEYNEIKDVGQGLISLIADARGMRQAEVQKEFGVAEQD
ncbi:Swi5-domain-containing protein [Aspergillus heterothallicus]